MSILDIVGMVVGGGGIGALAGIGTGVLTYFNKKSERSHDLQMEAAKRDTAIAVQSSITEGKIAEGELKAFSDSFKHDSTAMSSEEGKSSMFGTFIFGTLDFVKGVVRPLLVGVLVWMTYHIYVDLNTLVLSYGKEIFSAEEAVGLIKQTIQAVLALTATCVGWYFADRRIGKSFSR